MEIKNNNAIKTILSAWIISIFAVGFLFFYFYQPAIAPERHDKIFCTQEVKQCPDGSYVARTGPNCEFAKCPDGGDKELEVKADKESDISTWKTYRNDKYGFEVKYPQDFIVYKGFFGDDIVMAGSEDDEVWVARNSNLLKTGEFSNLGVNIINTNLGPRAWLDQNKKDYTDEGEIKSIRDVKFAGRDAVELNGSCNITSVCKLIVVKIPNYLAVIISNGEGGEFDEILFTFRFLE